MAIKSIPDRQIQIFQEPIEICNKLFEKLKLEIEIDRVARSIIGASLKPEALQELMSHLLQARAQLIEHTPINGLKGSCLYLNLIQNVVPSPLCPAYNKIAVPTVSTYHTIAWNISSIRLDSKAVTFVPEAVLNAAGNLEGKEVDILWTAIDGRFYHFDRPLNHTSHIWAHRHALPGPEKVASVHGEVNNPHSNISFDVNMGIFPEIGLKQSEAPGAIAINSLSPIQVHVHAREGAKKPLPNDMLFSPDNACFEALPGSPFALDWSVMQKDNRIAITKRLVIFDYTHPICAALVDSINNCDNLATHLQSLKSVSLAIDDTFSSLIADFENDKPSAMEAFHQLPVSFQNGIYREAWVLFGSLLGIHGDFGKASFEKNNSLEGKFHCNNQQCANAIRLFSKQMKHLLVESQYDLMLESQSLVKGDNVLAMMKCAQLFYKDPEEAILAITQLPKTEQEAIYFAFWELSGCPRTANYGSDNFALNCNNKKEIELKIQAILLAASRQPHHFETPFEKNREGVEVENQKVMQLKEKINAFLSSPALEDSPKGAQEDDFDIKVERPIADFEISLQAEVNEQIMELAFDPIFLSLTNPEKAQRINKLLATLDKESRNRIYGSVYANSQDPKKGGEAWGEKHIADDLEVLINSLHDGLT